MRSRVTRRRMLGLMSAGAAAAVGPVGLGWRRLLAQAAGSPPATTSTPNSTIAGTEAPPPDAIIPPPIEDVVFSGNVDGVLGPAQFIGSGESFARITVDMSQTPASKIYPDRHQPNIGDTFHSRGRWLGETGESTWQIEFVDFNIFHIKGALSPSAIADGGVNYAMVDSATGRRWQLVMKAANLTHFTIHATSPIPTDALLSFPEGTGADMIGYEDRPARPAVLVVTFLEVHP